LVPAGRPGAHLESPHRTPVWHSRDPLGRGELRHALPAYRPLRAAPTRWSSLSDDEAGTRRAAKGTVGLRIRVRRFDARAKLSQNKQPDVAQNVIAHLEPRNPALAEEMNRAHQQSAGSAGCPVISL